MNDTQSELAWLRTLFDAMEDALFVHDLEGRILECNAAACTRMGYTRQEFLRMRTRDFDAPEFAAGFADRVKVQLAHRRHHCEGIHLAKNGTPIHVDIHTTLIDFRGQPAVLAVMRDITERKRAEVERDALQTRVLQAEKLESLGVMAGGIAHDFNNLLMGVLGNASIALLDAPADSQLRRCLESIESAAQRAANLSQQMLAYSGRATFTFKRVDLCQMVRDAAPRLATAVTKNVRIEYRLEGEASIHADESQLRQVLTGIVTNAAEAYGEREGVVTVSVGVEHVDLSKLKQCHVSGTIGHDKYAVLGVDDAGSGMNGHVVERIFDPFFTTKFTGRGLGLAAVLGIVRGHRGAISVCSAVDQGTSFRVYLPASKWSSAIERKSQPAPEAPLAQGVLFVDDEEVVLSVGRNALERAGFAVYTASSGEQAVEILGEHRNDIGLVILDMTMPRMSGEDTYDALKRILGDVHVVISSGFSKAEAAMHFDAEAIADFLQKPYRIHDLVHLVEGVLQPSKGADAFRSSDFQI